MSVFVLQIIAMVTMLCDHLALVFFDQNVLLRSLGRFAFIIYAFLLAEGFRHFKDDKNRVLSHLGGYVLLALISEPCYDLFETASLSVKGAMASQSAMITLLIGFLCLLAIKAWEGRLLLQISAVLLGASCGFLILSNFKFAGVLLICALYFYVLKCLDKSYVWRVCSLLAIFALYLPLYHWARYDFCSLDVHIAKLTAANISWYITHIFIAFVLAAYRGELGLYSKKIKAFYKMFYPLHLFILGVLRRILGV